MRKLWEKLKVYKWNTEIKENRGCGENGEEALEK